MLNGIIKIKLAFLHGRAHIKPKPLRCGIDQAFGEVLGVHEGVVCVFVLYRGAVLEEQQLVVEGGYDREDLNFRDLADDAVFGQRPGAQDLVQEAHCGTVLDRQIAELGGEVH